MKRIFLALICFFIYVGFLYPQDVIYKSDGETIDANVIEIAIETIKYKNYNQMDSPVRNILKSDVFMIIYEDGTREVFKNSKKENIQPDHQVERRDQINKDQVRIQVLDNRSDPQIVGKSTQMTSRKIKDNKNKVFPAIRKLFLERLARKGFSNTTNTKSAYTLDILLNELWVEDRDAAVLVVSEQFCSVDIVLKDKSSTIYKQSFSSNNKCPAKEIRDYVTRNGYEKKTVYIFNGATGFLKVIDDIIQKLLEDDEFIDLFAY